MCAQTISARVKLQQQNQHSGTILSMQLGWPGQRPVQVSLQRQAAWSLCMLLHAGQLQFVQWEA